MRTKCKGKSHMDIWENNRDKVIKTAKQLYKVKDEPDNTQLQAAMRFMGCSVNQMTLKNGVEATIKKYAPEIEEVINVA